MNEEMDNKVSAGIADSLGVEVPKPEEVTPMAMESLRERLRKHAMMEPPAFRRPLHINPGDRLPRRSRLLSVENEPVVAHARLNDEWYCDDWTRVIAYGLIHAKAWQYSEMMDEVHALLQKRSEDHPDEDPQLRDVKVLQEWARKKLSNGDKKTN